MTEGLKDLDGKVAVVTGGAGGIGRALVEAFLGEGMKVVVADVEAPALEQTVGELTASGGEAVGVVTDVVDAESVQRLADTAFATFGAVHVLVNNAGVGPPSAKVWETTPNDWRWTFNVNVHGVANGVLAFVPRMVAGDQPGVVINTSSTDGGIGPMPQASVYAASKAAVTTLTECLDAQLVDETDGRLRAGVFYPAGKGLLDTGLWTSDRNRPDDLARERPRDTPALTVAQVREMSAKAGRDLPVQPLDEVAANVVDGIRTGRFVMILPSYDLRTPLAARLERLVDLQNPTTSHPLF